MMSVIQLIKSGLETLVITLGNVNKGVHCRVWPCRAKVGGRKLEAVPPGKWSLSRAEGGTEFTVQHSVSQGSEISINEQGFEDMTCGSA